MAKSQRTETDLESIRIKTQGLRDVVFLRHNGQRIFSLVCKENGSSTFTPGQHLLKVPNDQLENIFREYMEWKRLMYPQFRLPDYRQRTKDGHHHPWAFKYPSK